jgi:drug/metabolite transporter (DMT)-like permease
MGELRGRALWAWVIVCLVWGSTYLAIRVGVESLPPFLFAGVRWTLAALALAGIARLMGESLPAARKDWITLMVTGLLLITGGNGLVVWAEQYVDSGSASIYVVTVAIWSAAFDAFIPGGKTRFCTSLVAGLALGLVGTFILTGVTPATLLSTDLRGPLALVAASGAWAFGSVYLKRNPVGVTFSIAAAVQMLAGAIGLLLIALLLGESIPTAPSLEGLGALAYLIVFGSLVGFTAFGYALRHASPTVVGTYAYVNPVVAVLLGAVLLGEDLGLRKVVAMGIILAAVLVIQRATAPKRRLSGAPAPART